MSRDLGRPFALVLLVGLLLLGVLVSVLPSPDAQEGQSVFSAEDDGRRAAFALLDDLGFRPRAWTRAPGHLPSGDHLLFLPAAPEPPPAYYDEAAGDAAVDEEGRTRPVRAVSPRRLRDPMHYLRFLEEGGTLVTGLWGDQRAFLRDVLGIHAVEELAWARYDDDDERETLLAILPSGEQAAVEAWDTSVFEPLALASSFRVLVADDEGRPLAVSLPVGRGALVLLSLDTFFDNADLANAENGLLLVRLVEDLRPNGSLLFDEYALGGWMPDNPVALALTPRNAGFSLHLLALLVLLLWSAGWVREFPRDPEPLAQLSAVERARSYAGLLTRVGRWDLLARMLRAGVLRRIAGRTGARAAAAVEGEDGLDLAPEAVGSVLGPLGRRLGGPAAGRRLQRLFVDERPRSREELERMGAELARLEARLAAPPAASPSAAGAEEPHAEEPHERTVAE